MHLTWQEIVMPETDPARDPLPPRFCGYPFSWCWYSMVPPVLN